MNFVLFYSICFEIIQFFLLPFLKLQGKKVRKNVLKLPEATGNRSGVIGKGQIIKILCIGDSSASGVGVEHIDLSLSGNLINNLKLNFKCKWKVIAKSGVNSNQLIDLLLLEKNQKFKFVVISIGMNDITSGNSLIIFKKNLIKLENILSKKFSVNYFIYSGMPPVHKLKTVPNPLKSILAIKALIFDKFLRLKCERNINYIYININKLSFEENMVAKDGFHPSENFYKIWSEEISNIIKKEENY